MKKLLLFLAILIATSAQAQWVQIDNGLDGYPPTSIYPSVFTMNLSTEGGGIYSTEDNGDNWVNTNGNLGNLYVNDVRGPFVATQGGLFFSADYVNYVNNTGDLGNTDVNIYYWGSNNGVQGEFWVGTNGGGLYVSDNQNGSWTTLNNGLDSDGALIINDFGGYSDNDIDYAILATEGGPHYLLNESTTWLPTVGGLEGDAMHVQKITGLGSMVFIATHSGLYMSTDFTAPWLPLVADEKLNETFIIQNDASSTGFMIFAFGENGFYSEDFSSFIPLDMSGVDGEVTAAFANTTHLFIGVTTGTKGNRDSGSTFRMSIDELVFLAVDEIASQSAGKLHQNYPNPFSNSTKINYIVKEKAVVSIKVFDALGREVKTLINQSQTQGSYSINFTGSEINGSVFYYSLYLNNNLVSTKKMMRID